MLVFFLIAAQKSVNDVKFRVFIYIKSMEGYCLIDGLNSIVP